MRRSLKGRNLLAAEMKDEERSHVPPRLEARMAGKLVKEGRQIMRLQNVLLLLTQVQP